MASLEGKVIALTGAASGIGLETATLLAQRGAILSIADINGAQLSAAAKSLQDSGARVISTVVDVSKAPDVQAFISKTVTEFGRLDGAANLAGVIGRHGSTIPLRSETDDEWDLIMNVNAKGVFNCMREELKVMKAGASVVNAASVLALVGKSNASIYCASKHAVAGMIRAAAREEGKNKIRVNGVAPGFIDTPMVSAVEQAQHVTQVDFAPQAFERKGKPVEIAAIIAFLLSDESTFVTGSVWTADGGWQC
ncbi:uncharacterized protein A1O9_06570 [Exophiala aquamarina CBS 119918]|uniref:Oxidoreductase n=1 Tax=Exophiala aquamarina CBS 119918 TaxID=1182545 RepID=A0A072PET8_9EURO|nr:uncharacterized protein A1O9_06570 [Exophiala aquamarina CBS 119918]KEF58644.1 hypothetical protein A1O9_06570 [Exophiala aquamarina CBS 119918]